MEILRRLAGCAVTVRCDDERIAAMLLPWLDLFRAGAEETGAAGNAAAAPAGAPAAEPGAPTSAAPAAEIPFTVTFHAVADAAVRPPSPGAQPLVDYFYVSGAVDASGAVFRGADGSWLHIDPATGVAEAELPRGSLDGPPWVARDLFNAALTTLLRARGRFPLHAAALEFDGRGLLIVGPPMAGKTTLSLNLLRRGWGWVADDKVLVRSDNPESVRATGLFRQSNIDPALADHFPELAELREMPPAHPHSPKRAVLLNRFYGHPDRSECAPEWLLFPQVRDVGPTRWESLAPRETFFELLRQSPVVNETRVTGTHLACLSRLAAACRSFRLLMGRDILQDPARLAGLGREMDLPVGPPLAGVVKPRAGATAGSAPHPGRGPAGG